jgi:hypothetical protein
MDQHRPTGSLPPAQKLAPQKRNASSLDDDKATTIEQLIGKSNVPNTASLSLENSLSSLELLPWTLVASLAKKIIITVSLNTC